MNKLWLLFALVGLLAFAGSSLAQSADGQWNITDGQFRDQAVPSSALSSMNLKITGNNFEAKSGSNNSSGMVTTNRRARPAQLTFKINSGADTGREIKAIYELVQGKLKIVFSQDDQFPTEFSATAANNYLLLNYEADASVAAAQQSSGRNRSGWKARAPINISRAGASGPGG